LVLAITLAGPSASPVVAATAHPPLSDAALRTALQADADVYLRAHAAQEHISAVSATVVLPGSDDRTIDVHTGTMTFAGTMPLPANSQWQIGSNTKAFTAAMLLQLEAEHHLSMDDTVGKWLPQYPAWRAITIRRLLNMTSGIPSYDQQPAFMRRYAANPTALIPTKQLIAFADGLPLEHGYYYSNTAYLLSMLIAEKAGHAPFGEQLTVRFFRPLGLKQTFFHEYFNPPAINARMPAGYFADPSIPLMHSLYAKDVRPWCISWQQGAGGIVASTGDLSRWVRALYGGRVLAPMQQRELEHVVSMKTGTTIGTVSPADPHGFGLGVMQADIPKIGTIFEYEGGTMGFRTLYVYLPKSGAVVATGLNSSASTDDIGKLALEMLTTVEMAGRL
jgi:D-alanyl-D-alanine carboxypeptidase